MNNREPLSEAENKVYKFLVRYIRENRYSPTIMEIQKHCQYSSRNSAVAVMKRLKKKGYIVNSSSKNKTTARTLRLVDDVIGDIYIVDAENVSKAVKKLEERGYKIKTNEAIELLTELHIGVT